MGVANKSFQSFGVCWTFTDAWSRIDDMGFTDAWSIDMGARI
jgi:hypothetical protein